MMYSVVAVVVVVVVVVMVVVVVVAVSTVLVHFLFDTSTSNSIFYISVYQQFNTGAK